MSKADELAAKLRKTQQTRADTDNCADLAIEHWPAQVYELYRQIETMIMQDAPWLPLCHEQFAVLRHPRVRGEMWHPVWLWRYENAWLQN